jgi:hypothetical protein
MIPMLSIIYNWPSQNVLAREHYRKRAKQVELLTHAVKLEMELAGVAKATGIRTVHFIAHRKALIRDEANLIGGSKSIVDACKHAGLLVDDDDKNCLLSFEQRKLEKGQTPRVEIFGCDGVPWREEKHKAQYMDVICFKQRDESAGEFYIKVTGVTIEAHAHNDGSPVAIATLNHAMRRAARIARGRK